MPIRALMEVRTRALYTNSIGVAETYKVSGGDNRITITDGTGTSHTINANDSKLLTNQMARDYWLGQGSSSAGNSVSASSKTKANAILTSSFCAVHGSHRPCTSTRTHQAKGLGILRSLQPARLRPRPRQEPEQ